jgi:hypothetical protein
MAIAAKQECHCKKGKDFHCKINIQNYITLNLLKGESITFPNLGTFRKFNRSKHLLSEDSFLLRSFFIPNRNISSPPKADRKALQRMKVGTKVQCTWVKENRCKWGFGCVMLEALFYCCSTFGSIFNFSSRNYHRGIGKYKFNCRTGNHQFCQTLLAKVFLAKVTTHIALC